MGTISTAGMLKARGIEIFLVSNSQNERTAFPPPVSYDHGIHTQTGDVGVTHTGGGGGNLVISPQDYAPGNVHHGGGGGGGGGGCAECLNCLSVSGGSGLVEAMPNAEHGDYITQNSWTLVGLGTVLIGLLGSTTFFYWSV